MIVSQTFAVTVSIAGAGAHQPRAVLDIGGNQYEFRPSDGVAYDPYYDPMGQFVQDSICCTNPGLPGFRAYYRPDQRSSREEWVFEFSDCWLEPVPANLPAYTARITTRTGEVVTISAPVGHYWHARWRWQSAPRPVRRTAHQLWSEDLIPAFDTAGLVTGGIINAAPYSPMATCGMPANQGSTGGYWGLGIQTGQQTQFLIRGAPEASFRNVAEAAGSYQSNVRDTKTGAPIDLWHEYPNATMYASNTGSPYFAKGTVINKTDTGHMPSAAYLPFLLTGDPYYLEAVQYWANQNMLGMPGNGSRFSSQGRYFAWPLRAVYECYLATPESVPTWLLPRAYWLHWVDVAREIVEDRMANASDPYYFVFHSMPDYGQSGSADPPKSGDHVWQQNMIQLVAAWIASLRDEWVEPAEWLIHNGVARASATSGWQRSRPSPYHIRLQNASALAEAMDTVTTTLRLQYVQRFAAGQTVTVDSEQMVLGASADGLTWSVTRSATPKAHAVNASVYGNKCLSWAEAADLNALNYGWPEESNDALSPGTTDLTYIGYQRAALAQAIHAGLEVPGLLDAAQWLDSEIRRLISSKQTPGIGDNWACVPNVVRRRRRHRRSERTDPQLRPELLALLDEIRGAD